MKLYLCLDNFPAENQKLPGKGRSCTSVWTTSRLKIRHHRKRAAWYTHFWKTWFGRLSICHFTSIFEWDFFIIIEKQQFWTMAINIWLHYLFIFFIILEDWIYFRDNKIVRWFHKKICIRFYKRFGISLSLMFLTKYHSICSNRDCWALN